MARTLNKVTLIGHLGGDPHSRHPLTPARPAAGKPQRRVTIRRARKERPMTTTTSKQREAALVSDRWLRPMMGLGVWEALPARDVPYELSDPYILLHEATLRPIVCVGETLEQRDRGNVEKILSIQLRGSLKDLSEKELQETVIAYEPVWAIGTGRNATPEQAQEAHTFIRHTLRQIADDATAERVRIQYGGSVKPENARELMSQPDIDGALVGGASLDPRSFAEIVKAARGEVA